MREESTLPPEILLPGARHSQDVKCLAVGHAFRSVPHSPTSFNASDGPKPWISVKSTPTTPYSAALTSKRGRVELLGLHPRFGQFTGRSADLSLSADIKDL